MTQSEYPGLPFRAEHDDGLTPAGGVVDAAGEDVASAVIPPATIPPTCEPMILCFSPKRWQGPLPGIVIRAHPSPEGGPALANVRVMSDVPGMLESVTLVRVAVYDPLPDCVQPPEPEWCEWMPVQVEQAARHREREAAEKAAVPA